MQISRIILVWCATQGFFDLHGNFLERILDFLDGACSKSFDNVSKKTLKGDP